MNLGKFAKAPRLRWLWKNWGEVEKPWKELQTLCSDKDRVFFAKHTRIKIGDGRSTSFWNDTWLGEEPLKDKLPNLFGAARFKNRTVVVELMQKNWIRSVKNITTTQQIQGYIYL